METRALDVKVDRIYKLQTDTPLKAFVDIIVNNAILIRGIRVVHGKNGLFVSMPKDKSKDDRWFDRVRCLDKAMGDQLANEVLRAYRESTDSNMN